MAEIILEPTVQSKVIPLSIRLNDTDTSLVSQLVTNRQFSTADTDAWFSFTLEGLAATTGTFDLTLINLQDKSVFNHTDKVFNTNPFYYKLDSGTDELTNEIRHAGKWVGQLVVTLANGDSATRKFIFGIEGHILDGTVVQTVLLEDYNALISDIESAKDELTQYNIDYSTLISTVESQEAARVQAELTREQTFNVLVDSEIIAQNVVTKLTEKEATYAPRLLTAEQQLAENTTVLQGIDKTFGNITFATLLALQTAYPTGDTKRYIVAADGKWYYWSGSAWASGQVAQAIGIVDKSQGLNQLSSDLSLANYPFTNPSVRKDLLKFGVVLDAVLIGADRTKAYTIGGLRKNFGGTNNTRIQVHEWDLTTGAWAGGSVATAIRASWSRNNYVPAKTTEIVKLAAIGTSGFKVELLVDWTKIPDGISYSWEGGHFHLFHPNTISKGQTFLPNVFKSRQNIDKAFPDTAFYTGHWFKKTVNTKECISTNLFGNEINFIFKGPSISVDVEYVGYSASLYVAVDGVGSSWVDIASSGEKVIKSGLADTEHIVTLWTQPRFGDTADASPFFSGKGGINIVGFNVPTFPIYGSKRTLVFYGDSITAGQGDRFIGYAKRIEQFLPINTIRVAQPSAPLVQRTDRPYIPTLSQFFNQSANGVYARPMPADIVLTNIGTNDDSWLSSEAFETALTNLVNALKIRHGGAPICLISPFGGYRATETANVAAATGVYLVDTTGWTYTTADGLHPDEGGAAALAQKLSADLIDKFGFDFFNMI